jgi:16S rRNA G966 N2-methylase RsmD
MVYHLENSVWVKKNHPEGLSLTMIEDTDRVDELIKPAIKRKAKDKVVIDLGCGSGLLGMYAFDYGAKFVYFVEQDSFMIETLRNSLPKMLDPSKFKIIHKYAQDLTRDDFDCGEPELCVSELQGPQLYDEGCCQCTLPIRQMYENLVFIPEVYRLDIIESDVDYSKWPWPQNEKRLLEHYKYMYSKIGWTNGFIGLSRLIELVNPKKIGELIYDTRTGIFKNTFTTHITAPQGKMINMFGVCQSDELENITTKFGWYVYPRQEQILLTVYNPNTETDSRIMFSLALDQD